MRRFAIARTTPPRAVHFSSVHQPFDVRIFEKQCRSLAADGWDVTFVVPHTKDDERDGVKIRAVPVVRSRPLRMLLTTARVALRVLRLRADVYHFHDPELLPVGVLLKLLGRRVIYDSHEDMPRAIQSKPYLAKGLRNSLGRVYEIVENWCVRRLDAVVAATGQIAERFAGVGARAVEVTNYPQLDDFPPPPTGWQKENAACFVGGITRIRGILEIIDAAELAEVRLILAGKFASEALRAEAMARPGWKWVEELGVVSRAETVEVMRRSFVGLVLYYPEPNHLTAQPNKLFEYMAAGLPVIASDFPMWRQIVQTAGFGVVVDPHDPPRIAEELRKLRDDPERAREAGTRGRRAVEEIYNWMPEYKKLRALYANIAGPARTEATA
jgi:glycosyltransferase involved in cell wall biosynthesis